MPPIFQGHADQDPDDQQKHERQPVFHGKQDSMEARGITSA